MSSTLQNNDMDDITTVEDTQTKVDNELLREIISTIDRESKISHCEKGKSPIQFLKEPKAIVFFFLFITLFTINILLHKMSLIDPKNKNVPFTPTKKPGNADKSSYKRKKCPRASEKKTKKDEYMHKENQRSDGYWSKIMGYLSFLSSYTKKSYVYFSYYLNIPLSYIGSFYVDVLFGFLITLTTMYLWSYKLSNKK